MFDLNEMIALRNGLDKRGIAWRDHSDKNFVRTRFINKYGVECSVIIGCINYGHQGSFLETMPTVHDIDDDMEGYLTAVEILTEWC